MVFGNSICKFSKMAYYYLFSIYTLNYFSFVRSNSSNYQFQVVLKVADFGRRNVATANQLGKRAAVERRVLIE